MIRFILRWQIVLAVISTVLFCSIAILLFHHVVYSWSGLFAQSEAEGVKKQVTFDTISDILQASESEEQSFVSQSLSVATTTISFVGDILLARSVEFWMREEGGAYPFKFVPDIVGSSSAVYGNFEAAIPLRHEQTVAYSTRFSTDAKHVNELAQSGITHVSLANNHSFDFGKSAEINTRFVLERNGLVPFGHADKVASSSISTLVLGSTTVTVLALQTVYGAIDQQELRKLIATMRSSSDIQIAYIHWGTEYALSHSPDQELLAQYLVSLGIDIIIGHHPHVVQDIQLIQGVPVFYSLGNFIFDQYFSEAVQQGLALRVQINSGKIHFVLDPVTSLNTHAQPRPMTGVEREHFLADLANRSDITLKNDIINGFVTVPPTLQN